MKGNVGSSTTLNHKIESRAEMLTRFRKKKSKIKNIKIENEQISFL